MGRDGIIAGVIAWAIAEGTGSGLASACTASRDKRNGRKSVFGYEQLGYQTLFLVLTGERP
ncbi:MAG: hypothetical protein OEV08_09675 [Nitrospira sp.]|nr:hypothetical protein [Nitrospira sp.]